jgi:flagellum-specific peptidoglycan hydrolase FlgJ
MNLKNLILIIILVGFTFSCKSKRKVANQKPKQKIENVKPIENEKQPKTLTTEPESIANTTLHYIETYKEVAMDEMRRFNIPASIKLAQGILESGSGRSELTKRSNNHFGIKCHTEWNGKRTYHDDDEKGECFRVYQDPRTSFRDHSLFLTQRKRYSNLFKLHKGDYVSWAKGLSEAGYATDRRYPAKLIAVIEKYELHKYDTEVLGKPFEIKQSDEWVENSNLYIVQKGDTLYSISKRYGLTVEQLMKLNGLTSNNLAIGQKLVINK